MRSRPIIFLCEKHGFTQGVSRFARNGSPGPDRSTNLRCLGADLAPIPGSAAGELPGSARRPQVCCCEIKCVRVTNARMVFACPRIWSSKVHICLEPAGIELHKSVTWRTSSHLRSAPWQQQSPRGVGGSQYPRRWTKPGLRHTSADRSLCLSRIPNG